MIPRLAGPGDSDRLAAVHAEAFPQPWPVEEIAALLRQAGVFGLMIGYPAEGFVLCRIAAGEGEILTLATGLNARRHGLGRSLLWAALAEFGSREAEAVFLEVACDNLAALGLYRGAGFAEAGVRRDYYARSDGAVDGLVLRCVLNTARA